jgi:hypothetical protein
MSSALLELDVRETETLESMALITDLPNAPPARKIFPDAENHTDVPAVDVVVVVDIDIDIDIVFVDIDIDIDIDVDIDTPHVDTP